MLGASISRHESTEGGMTGCIRERLIVVVGMLASALAVGCGGSTSPSVVSRSTTADNTNEVEPATTFRVGTFGDIVAGVNEEDNQVFWTAQDLHRPAKAAFSFNTTPALGVGPHLLLIGIKPDGNLYESAFPTRFTTSDDPPSIHSALGSVVFDPVQQAFHMTVDVPLFFSCDLWFKGHPGGATVPTIWDGQTSYWIQSIGAGTVNGTIRFPGSLKTTTVTDWGGEQETQYGTFQLGGGLNPLKDSPHIGYDYAASDNPDGSEDVLYVFPELSGVWRGILVHTSADGVVTQCEPSGPHEVTLSNWTTDPLTRYHYPQTVSASCDSLAMTWTVDWTNVLGAEGHLNGFETTDSTGHSSVPGSVAALQHLRDTGYYGETP